VLLALERWEEAAALAAETLAVAQERRYLPMIWRLEASHWRALDVLGQKERAEEARRSAAGVILDLAERITDPMLRRQFVSGSQVAPIVEVA
jgi:hypothetical protein